MPDFRPIPAWLRRSTKVRGRGGAAPVRGASPRGRPPRGALRRSGTGDAEARARNRRTAAASRAFDGGRGRDERRGG
eukprot:gene16458-5239_t